MNHSPKKMQELLNEKKFTFKKKYGQNFIIDENIIKSIVTKANVDKDTLVIEIGPGAGSLTSVLANNAKNVLCYEVDETLNNVLKENLKDYNNVKVIYADFLKVNVLSDIKKYKYKKLYVVANLPYYITTPIIIKLINDKLPLDKVVVMVQKEVGDRIKAMPGSKEYGSLTVYLNYYFKVKKLLDVSKNVFMPKPKVDSIVLEFTKHNSKKNVNNEQLLFNIIRDSFKQKRKTLRNNLKEYNLNIIEKELKKVGFDLSVRAEQLSLDIFIDIESANDEFINDYFSNMDELVFDDEELVEKNDQAKQINELDLEESEKIDIVNNEEESEIEAESETMEEQPVFKNRFTSFSKTNLNKISAKKVKVYHENNYEKKEEVTEEPKKTFSYNKILDRLDQEKKYNLNNVNDLMKFIDKCETSDDFFAYIESEKNDK